MPIIIEPTQMVDAEHDEAQQNDTENTPDFGYDPNEVHPHEGERRGFYQTFIWEKVSLIVTLSLIVLLAFAFIYNLVSDDPVTAVGTPSFMLLPIGFSAAVWAILSGKKEKYMEKQAIVNIIDRIGGNEISISKILDIYKPNHNGKETVRDDMIARVMDILWDGYITEYKYIIDEKKLVKIETEGQ